MRARSLLGIAIALLLAAPMSHAAGPPSTALGRLGRLRQKWSGWSPVKKSTAAQPAGHVNGRPAELAAETVAPGGHVERHVSADPEAALVQLAPRVGPPSFGDRIADRVAGFGGSWRFIGTFTAGMLVWMYANTHGMNFDPPPFIGLNLMLSMTAALQAPVLLMSANRAAQRDRAQARADFNIDCLTHARIEEMSQTIDELRAELKHAVSALDRLHPNSMTPAETIRQDAAPAHLTAPVKVSSEGVVNPNPQSAPEGVAAP